MVSNQSPGLVKQLHCWVAQTPGSGLADALEERE
jgi:hypothetical protein